MRTCEVFAKRQRKPRLFWTSQCRRLWMTSSVMFWKKCVLLDGFFWAVAKFSWNSTLHTKIAGRLPLSNHGFVTVIKTMVLWSRKEHHPHLNSLRLHDSREMEMFQKIWWTKIKAVTLGHQIMRASDRCQTFSWHLQDRDLRGEKVWPWEIWV